jgi:hypothetical protein
MKNILSIKNFFLSATQLHPLKRPKKGEKKSPTLSLSLSVKPEREKQAQGNFFTLSLCHYCDLSLKSGFSLLYFYSRITLVIKSYKQRVFGLKLVQLY